MRITGHQVAAKRDKAAAQGLDTTEHVRIFLDGVEKYYVTMADEEEELIEVALIDDRGDFFAINDEVATMSYRGTVRIELPSWWTA